jgi:hypothetical protein
MVELTDEQYEKVARHVRETIVDFSLQVELIDHCCCSIEHLMAEGVAFELAFDRALLLLSPNGLKEVEVEIKAVLQPKISKIMKMTLYLTGFIASFFILIGMMFKMMHWPGATVILLSGDLSLVACMLCVQYSLLTRTSPIDKWTIARIFSGSLGGLLVSIGAAFKIMYWPMANILLVLGIAIVTFFFLPIFFWQLYQREMNKV